MFDLKIVVSRSVREVSPAFNKNSQTHVKLKYYICIKIITRFCPTKKNLFKNEYIDIC